MKTWTYITLIVTLGAGIANAKPRHEKPHKPAKTSGVGKQETTELGNGQKATSVEGEKVKTIDFTGISLSGRLRTPQLMYFLNRIRQELEAGTLDKRSFMPELNRSVNDDAL